MNSNLKSFGNIFKQEGTSQYERYLSALDPKKILLDDRKLQDFIAFAQTYSKNLLFVNADGKEVSLTESWEFFFKNDTISVIAGIAVKNANFIKTTYDNLSNLFKKEKSLQNFFEVAQYTLARYKKINQWYYSAEENSSLHSDLALYIGAYLQTELQSLAEIIISCQILLGNNYRKENFKLEFFNKKVFSEVDKMLSKDNIWNISNKENIALREQIFSGTNDEEKLENALLTLDRIFESVYHSTETIITNCNRYFEETIHAKQNHPPHIALFIAFVKLFGYVHEELNKIPERHLSFYYKDALQIKAREATPDEAFILLQLSKGFSEMEIKKGTPFSAGKDSAGKELVYVASESLIVNKAQVASLKTIFIDRDSDNNTLNYYSNMISSDAANANIEKTDFASKMFGSKRVKDVAEVGFAIASTQFYLAKGQRNVTITFDLENEISPDTFNTENIKLLLTAEAGWISSDDVESGITIISLIQTSSQSLELQFSISIAQQAAIIAFNPKIHAGNYQTLLPVLQCILKFPVLKDNEDEQQQTTYKDKLAEVNILQKIKILAVSINVRVGSISSKVSFDGVRDLLLQNNDSDIDTKKPFFPFTAIPKVGSAFYIGCKDLYYKKIQRLSLNIEWMLPDNFRDYYNKYLPPYDSNKFKASVSILKNKHWNKISDVSIIDKEASDPKFKIIKIDTDKINSPGTPPENSVATFDNERKDGTLMLKLSYPDFGHGIYPQLITSAVMEKASSKYGAVDFYKIVKRQLHDSVISIKLPDDINNPSGSLKVVLYNTLDRVKDDDQARTMMKSGLTDLITRFNGSNVVSKNAKQTQSESALKQDEGRVIVNDENYIERILGFLKKIKLIDKSIHYDEDMQDAKKVVDEVRDKINAGVDFIMPSEKELISVILNETNNAISKTVSNVVDQILEIRKKGNPDPNTIAALMKNEFGEANDVINDMIARKIAILLSANEIPPPPYSPVIASISLNYSSVTSSNDIGDEFFHITPFGVSRIDLLNPDNGNVVQNHSKLLSTKSIFPGSLMTSNSDARQMQGMLFLGVKDIEPSQNLSVLVQVAEGSKQNDKKPSQINWWYLKNNYWETLQQDGLVSDSTYGLQTTGILQFSIPKESTNNRTLFNEDSLYWLCASVAADAGAFPDLVDIKAQALTVRFSDHQNDPAHLALPLPAEKINGMVIKVPQIKSISQPVSSSKGQVKEREQEYFIRVSERLRHKSRAINNWDYERLVLEKFPSLYKVKCLNNYYSGRFATGHVTVVPITNLTNKNYAGNNVLLPKISYIELRNIESFLSRMASSFVKIHAVNPRLDQVLVGCKVKFISGLDKGFCLQKLNEELINFLTPWTAGNSNVVSFSAKIYASSIISFIDARKYVDYVEDFVMQQYNEDDNGQKVFCVNEKQLPSLSETIITSSHSILVSAPKHQIELAD